MHICLYSPYVPDHIGGGEKYLFDVAVTLLQRHKVSIALSQPGVAAFKQEYIETLKKKYERFLGYSLDGIEWIPTPLGTKANWWEKVWWTKQFDVLYYVTDGSLFFSLAKRNILHIQVPFHQPKTSLIERLKLQNWQVKNTNSQFTKNVVEQAWQININEIHHPMIDLPYSLSAAELQHKEPIILSVGRFFQQLHSKRQDVLVETFSELVRRQPQFSKGWKLVLIGAIEDRAYVNDIKQKAEGLPIEFHHNVTRAALLEWYKRSAIYWHAAGFGVNQRYNPEKVEHFGISTVEAMASGCVPVVIAKGGQVEILGEKLKHCLWQTPQECIEITNALLRQPPARWELAQTAVARAKVFGRAAFEKKLWDMVEG